MTRSNPICWIDSANAPGTDFPLHNLPFGVFKRDEGASASIGVAIGDQILDLRLLDPTLAAPSLNELMHRSAEDLSTLRQSLIELLSDAANRGVVEPFLSPRAEAIMCLPAVIGDYTDFNASIHHATAVGRLFRPGSDPLPPNYKYVPIGYHGRASSAVVSGAPIRRPRGQYRIGETIAFGPSRSLDFELEAGIFISHGNNLGEPIPIKNAHSHVFGLCLLNDWSARDIQAWESQPLGPFLSKSFATTISPWVVTMEALAPYRVPPFQRPDGDPEPLPYLDEGPLGGIDLNLEAWISSAKMRDTKTDPVRLCRSNLRDQYWTLGQLVTHHTSNGCNLRTGDLLGTGTVSGPGPDEHGCLLELTRNGAEPVSLPTGETRTFLEDGDEIILRGYCEREGLPRIGFGECRGVVQQIKPNE